MKLIVGLGNPGRDYNNTRHNLGFRVVDELAARHGLSWSASGQAKAEIAKGKIGESEVVLAKPQTFMNLSGQAVQALASFYKIEQSDIWVVHDELDIPFGVLRVRVAGDSAGNNGVKSVIEQLGSRNFGRFRLGVANNTLRNPIPAEAFVLQPFTAEEASRVSHIVDRGAIAIEQALESDITHQDVFLLNQNSA